MKTAKGWRKELNTRSVVTLIFILIVLFILGFFAEFINLINKNVNSETNLFLSEYTAQSINNIHKKFSDNFTTLEVLASFISTYDNIADPEVINILHEYSLKSKYTRLAVTTPDGISYTDTGETHDTSDREYFQRAMNGENYISDLIESKVDESKVIVAAVPIYRNNEIIGVLRYTIHADLLQSLFNTEIFGGKGFSYIIQPNGTIISTDADLEYKTNINDLLENAIILEDDSLQNFRDSLKKGESGILRYIHNNIAYYASYTPIGINQWYALTIVPMEVIQTRTIEISKIVLNLIIKEFILLILLFIYVLYLERKQIRHIYESNQKYEILTANIPGGVFRYTADEKQIMHFVSDGLLKLFGYTEKELRERIGNVFPNMIYEEDRERVLNELSKQHQTAKMHQIEYRIVNAWGDIKWVMHRGQHVVDSKGNEWFYALVTDITNMKKTQEELRLNEERYRIVAESSSSIIFECDAKDKSVTFLSKTSERYGYPRKLENYPQGFIDANIIHKDDVSEFLSYCKAITDGEYKNKIEIRCRQKDGSYRWCTLQMMPIYDEKNVLLKEIGRITDIDAEKKEREMLKEKSRRDPLTGFYNKSQTADMINDYLKNEGKGKTHALLFIDIDNFKAVNDNLGHHFGDSVLEGISSRVKNLFYNTDIAGRVGGDEFVILLKETETIDIICKKAEAICDIFKNAYTGNHKEYKISGSIGIALYDKDGSDYYELFKKADCALYYAKKMGKDRYEFYNDKMAK